MLLYRKEKKETLTLLKEQLHVMLGSSTSKVELLGITCNQTQQNFVDDIFFVHGSVGWCGFLRWLSPIFDWLLVGYVHSQTTHVMLRTGLVTVLDHRPEQCKYQRMERQQKDLEPGGEQASLIPLTVAVLLPSLTGGRASPSHGSAVLSGVM